MNTTCTAAADAVKPVCNDLKTDYERYQEIHASMSKLLRQMKGATDEFYQLWRESEQIKNRYAGMPPTP